MICEHLQPIEKIIQEKRIKEKYRGPAWSNNCREWVYYECFIDAVSLSQRLDLDECVEIHKHLGTHDGSEYGFYCNEHHDGIMGYPPEMMKGKIIVK
ncbi:MAG: hypothetical protein ACTHOM_15360 [Allomuricauda sp.]|uniref:Phage protein n=1 Tax=Flagellimonas profundi TaxID=2915620 RepID=A0ABS3FA86_9FLAO|nr:hypothetical protein [Allomuricauda profundi]MBO0340068.1 hypothetical protein [Allomuricauda profundi]